MKRVIYEYVRLEGDPDVEVEVYMSPDRHVHVEAWDYDDALGVFDISEIQAKDAIAKVLPCDRRPLYRAGWFSIHGRNNNRGAWTTDPDKQVVHHD